MNSQTVSSGLSGFRGPGVLSAPRFLLIIGLYWLLTACVSLPPTRPRPPHWATPVPAKHLQNFYRVDSQVYRSAQPDRDGMRELEGKGIHTVLDLRYWHHDEKIARDTNLTILHLPMMANDIDEKALRQAVALIRQAEKPVLVHCRYGADRTGAVIAAYRILEQGWSNEDAIEEMMRGGYGHHYLLFPNIRDTVTKLQPDDAPASFARPTSLHHELNE